MERGKWSGGYLNNFSLSTASPLKGGNEWSGESCGIAEVVGSNHPTRSISFILVNYGIISSLILGSCPTNSAAMRMPCVYYLRC
jgi:hypothetical protein